MKYILCVFVTTDMKYILIQQIMHVLVSWYLYEAIFPVAFLKIQETPVTAVYE
jgi:hypothetical protein